MSLASRVSLHSLWRRSTALRFPARTPSLPGWLLATMVLTVIIGLPLDRFGGFAGQLAVSAWTWALFFIVLACSEREFRLPFLLCLVISTVGECCFSLLWGLYVYWLHNIPLFVPPGHVVLFALGLTAAPRLPRWSMLLVVAFALGYGSTALLASIDTFSVGLAVLFLLFVVFGRNRQLYATMFVISLAMELYGTSIGNWAWLPQVPGTPFTSANPPLCVGGLYCALDLCVAAANRLLRKWLAPVPVIAPATSVV